LDAFVQVIGTAQFATGVQGWQLPSAWTQKPGAHWWQVESEAFVQDVALQFGTGAQARHPVGEAYVPPPHGTQTLPEATSPGGHWTQALDTATWSPAQATHSFPTEISWTAQETQLCRSGDGT
jgi:hypothetical protein